jgi:transaldolase
MQIWLDTVNLEIVKDAAMRGILSGVTTNPSILSQTRDVPATLAHLLELQPGSVAVQVTSHTADAMIEEARSIHAFSSRTIVKIPVHREGLKAMHNLYDEKIPVLGTGVFSPLSSASRGQPGSDLYQSLFLPY